MKYGDWKSRNNLLFDEYYQLCHQGENAKAEDWDRFRNKAIDAHERDDLLDSYSHPSAIFLSEVQSQHSRWWKRHERQWQGQRREALRSTVPARPAFDAGSLFYLFLDAKNCDAVVGDLEERYKLIAQKFGTRKANFWYWTQAIRSVMPIAWAWGKRVAMKPVVGIVAWAAARGLVGHDSWLAALVEFYRKLRS
jgi:hypothetical protein